MPGAPVTERGGVRRPARPVLLSLYSLPPHFITADSPGKPFVYCVLFYAQKERFFRGRSSFVSQGRYPVVRTVPVSGRSSKDAAEPKRQSC